MIVTSSWFTPLPARYCRIGISRGVPRGQKGYRRYGKQREQLRRALEFIREGDTLIVTRLDRLARSVRDLLDIVDQVERKRVALKILTMGLDTRDATGRLMLQVLGAVAEFERSLMLERQREGIAKARQAGKYKGRKPTARVRCEEIAALLAAGLGPTQVAKQLGIARSSVYRITAGG